MLIIDHFYLITQAVQAYLYGDVDKKPSNHCSINGFHMRKAIFTGLANKCILNFDGIIQGNVHLLSNAVIIKMQSNAFVSR